MNIQYTVKFLCTNLQELVVVEHDFVAAFYLPFSNVYSSAICLVANFYAGSNYLAMEKHGPMGSIPFEFFTQGYSPCSILDPNISGSDCGHEL